LSFSVKSNNYSVITNLSAVDELSQRDISVVAEDVDIVELVGSVLEFDAEEVADVGRRAAAELNSNGRGKVGFRQHELDIICYIGRRTYECQRIQGCRQGHQSGGTEKRRPGRWSQPT
jgi:hypothetical protein